MKKIMTLLVLILIISLSGCFKRDDMEGIQVYTTIYPIEYATERLYGYNSEVKSIYPDGVKPTEYKLTNKQINDYSDSEIFVYNGLSDEKKIARDFINTNKKLKIIDVSQGIEVSNDIEELWLSPTNYLMITQNIKNSLLDYIDNKYIKEEISENYENLKVDISEIDAELKRISENATSKTIVVTNHIFKFLEKYGFEVISIEDDGNLSNSTIEKVKSLISDGTIKYILMKQGETINETVASLTSGGKAETISMKTMTTLNDEQRKNKENYLTIMTENVEAIKKECYE